MIGHVSAAELRDCLSSPACGYSAYVIAAGVVAHSPACPGWGPSSSADPGRPAASKRPVSEMSDSLNITAAALWCWVRQSLLYIRNKPSVISAGELECNSFHITTSVFDLFSQSCGCNHYSLCLELRLLLVYILCRLNIT